MKHLILSMLAISLLTLSACGGGGGGGGEVSQAPKNPVLKSCGREGGPLKILPFGDSTTELERGHNSYRRQLWFSLQSAGCVIDFVGSKRGVSSGSRDSEQVNARNPDFDQDHEAYWDYRADELVGKAGGAAARFLPDIALIHAGSNDIIRGQSPESTISDVGAIIDAMRAARPDVIILLAKIISTPSEDGNRTRFNSQIDGLASAKFDPASPILVVDHAAGYSLSDNYDGVHPAPSGESKMADKWTNAILQLVASSE